MESTEHIEPTLLPAASASLRTRIEPVQFHGKGGEYFGIWIVNLLLTILTIGIYSAWAKVRRLRYFYQHTELAGAHFEYHGKPLAILKGRLIAVGLVLAYQLSAQVSFKLFAATLALVILITPWLMRQAFRFRLHNSSYRGLRFSFKGTLKDSYITFLLYGFLTLITVYLAAPVFHRQMKLYQHGNSLYGQSKFSFKASIGQFYGAYGAVIALSLLMLVLIIAMPIMLAGSFAGGDKPDAMMVGLITAGILLAMILGMLFIMPLWEARTQNLIWNQTTLGPHRFECKLLARRLMVIHLGNFVLVLLTLGLYMPWAAVRLARYRASAISMVTDGSLEDFAAAQEADQSATGEEAAEFFDIDIGL